MPAPVPDDRDPAVPRPDPAATGSHAPASGDTPAGFDLPPTTVRDSAAPPVLSADRTAPRVPGYEIGREIARGGMGVVLAAYDLALNRNVAIKTLLPHSAAGPGTVRRFVTEAQITAQLPHPGIPPVHALGTLPDGRPFLAMKLIQGRTLAAILSAREQQPADASDLPELFRVFEQICQAVAFAHSRGVIHRDLKPANVMVGAFGEVQVMDWGSPGKAGDLGSALACFEATLRLDPTHELAAKNRDSIRRHLAAR